MASRKVSFADRPSLVNKMPEISNTATDSKPAGTQTAEEITGMSSAELAECERVASLSEEDFNAEVAARVAQNDAIFEAFLGEELKQASPLKRKRKRNRASKIEVERRRAALYNIVKAMKPMTVRQVFYQATVHGIVEKSEAGYTKVQTDLVQMRRAGALRYDWLADNTRWQRKPTTFNSIEEALEDTARYYRKALWTDAGAYVEIWLEKDALAGVVMPITSKYDVPLMVARGYASLSFLHGAADCIADLDVPTYIYHLGDFDPSGVNAGEKIEQTLRELAPDAEIHFERIGVTLSQISAWNLPTRPTKTSDSRSKGFGDISVELDAIEPDLLRGLVKEAIEQHLPAEQFELLKIAEQSERELLRAFVGQVAT